MSSIPGHKPGPILNGPRKAILITFAIIPVGLYALLKQKETNSKIERRRLEEEGRRNWVKAERAAKRVDDDGSVGVGPRDGKDLSVGVQRSGGGV